MTTITIPEMTLHEFAAAHGLQVEVHERARPKGDPMRYYAKLNGVEVMRDGLLISTFGNGPTPEDAIRDAHSAYSLKRLVINAFKRNRREIPPHRLTPL